MTENTNEDNGTQDFQPDSVGEGSKDISDLTIQEARKLASGYGIKLDRTWNREEIILAINNRRKGHQSIVDVVYDTSKGPPVGHARIRLHLQQNGSNHPVPCAVNKYIVKIPRDVEVDVPFELLEVLNNSTKPTRVKDPSGRVGQDGRPLKVWGKTNSYPYNVIAMGPAGEACYRNGTPKIRPCSDSQKHNLKLKYREIYQRWPKRAQLRRFEEQHMEARAKKMFAAEED